MIEMQHRKNPFLLIFLFVEVVIGVSCLPSSEITETSVALTVASLAEETASASIREDLIMTNVAQTVSAMPQSETDSIETQINAIHTSVAQTVAAQFMTPISNSAILMRVNNETVNLRTGPDTCFEVITILSSDERASIIGRDPANQWYKIELSKDTIGWFWAEFADLLEPSKESQIPIITEIFACPTSVPSLAPTVVPSLVSPPPGNASTTIPATPTKRVLPTECPYPICNDPVATVGSTPTPNSCSYPPCTNPTANPAPTVGSTPTPNSCSYPPCLNP